MNDTVLAETLRDWSQEAEVPHDLAHRVLARRQARRRRLVLPAVAGLATAAVVVAALVVGGTVGPVSTHDGPPAAGGMEDVHADTTHNPPQEVVLAGDVAVSAIVTYTRVPAPPDGWQTLQRRYAVANPTTGRYEPRNWTYAAVAPGLETAAMLKGPLPSSQVGFVDLATGKVTRWVQLDHPVASLAWSPDGSTVVATAYDGDPDLEKPEGNGSFRMGDAKRTGFVLVDPEAGTASFTALPNREMNVGRADVGWTADGKGVWSPSGTPDELFFDLEGRPTIGNRDDINSNLGIGGCSALAHLARRPVHDHPRQRPARPPSPTTRPARLPTGGTAGAGLGRRRRARRTWLTLSRRRRGCSLSALCVCVCRAQRPVSRRGRRGVPRRRQRLVLGGVQDNSAQVGTRCSLGKEDDDDAGARASTTPAHGCRCLWSGGWVVSSFDDGNSRVTSGGGRARWSGGG